MTKPLFTEATPPVRRLVESKYASGDLVGALLCACGYGYDVPEPSQTHIRELERLRETDPVVAGGYAIHNSAAIDQQRRAHVMWLGRRKWAAGPSPAEMAAAAKAEQDAKDRAAAIEKRTLEILETAEQETRAKRLTEARKRAQKELTK